MGDPRIKQEPTLQDVLLELTSAMSALNMPDPAHCPPDMVQHAYGHIEAAVEMLVALHTEDPGAAVETWPSPTLSPQAPLEIRRRGKQTLYRVAIQTESLGYATSINGLENIWATLELQKDVVYRLHENFAGRRDTDETRFAIMAEARAMYQRYLDQGHPDVLFEYP